MTVGIAAGTGTGRTWPWPKRLISGSLIGRARLPLTSQVEAVVGSWSSRAGKVLQVENASDAVASEPIEAKRNTGDGEAGHCIQPARETAGPAG